jgi:hypothetical protein
LPTYKGRGLYEIVGRAIKGKMINGANIRWSDLAPWKVFYKEITGGYTLINNLK